jgi:hypothetical protein
MKPTHTHTQRRGERGTMVIEFFVEYLDDDFLFRAVDNGEENFDSFVDESILLLQKKKKNCAHIFTEISNPVDCSKKRRDELLDRCVRVSTSAM